MLPDGHLRRPPGAALSHRAATVALAVLTLGAVLSRPLVEAVDPQTLLPWVAVPALAIAWTFRRPAAVDLFDPFVFLSWTHYAPMYVVGAFLLAAGVVGYPYDALIADPVAACALALLYTVIGYLALGLGCRWRGTRALGAHVVRLLPPAPAGTIPLGAILVLGALGGLATYAAFRAGIVGFAVARTPGPFDAAATYTGVLLSLGHFLFWFRWFDRQQARPSRVALAIPLLLVLFAMTIAGNRGSVLASYLVAALAFGFAKGRLTLRQGTAVVALAFVALGLGMAYGTVFRTLKGGETGAETTGAVSRPSLRRQVAVASATARTLTTGGWSGRVTGILGAAGRRLNIVSDASVAVARAPELRPLEPEYGVADLWTMTWTGLVPRMLWPGKPMVGNARAYSALYFGDGSNSYAWTPPTDFSGTAGRSRSPSGWRCSGSCSGRSASP